MIGPSCGANTESQWYCRTCGAPQPAASLPQSGVNARNWPRRLAWVLGLLAVALTVLLVLASLSFDPAALALSVAASAIPAAIYCYLVLRLDRYERLPIQSVIR